LDSGNGIWPIKTGYWYADNGDVTRAFHVLIVPVGATATSIISCFSKIQNGLPFYYQLNQVQGILAVELMTAVV